MRSRCASSGSAFFHAVSGVASGLYDLVMVVGVEKMTSQPTPKVTEILAGAGDLCGEVKAGATLPNKMQEIRSGIEAGQDVVASALVFQNTAEQ